MFLNAKKERNIEKGLKGREKKTTKKLLSIEWAHPDVYGQ